MPLRLSPVELNIHPGKQRLDVETKLPVGLVKGSVRQVSHLVCMV